MACGPHRCWVLLSPLPRYCLLFTPAAPVPHSLSHGGQGQPAVAVSSVGTHVCGIGLEKKLLPQAGGHSGRGSQHSTTVWGEILTILGFLPELFN